MMAVQWAVMMASSKAAQKGASWVALMVERLAVMVVLWADSWEIRLELESVEGLHQADLSEDIAIVKSIQFAFRNQEGFDPK